jgi:hypothetical protein
VRVLGVGLLFDFANVDGIGWVMRECSDDVLLGTMALSTVCSRVVGRLVSLVPGLATEVIDV